MHFPFKSRLSGLFRELVVGYSRELLFWILLLPALSALGSMSPRRQIVGVVETMAFLFVAISSGGKLKNLGLQFAHWNPLAPHTAALCVVVGAVTGGAMAVVAQLSRQSLGAEVPWNKALLVIVLGPVLEEVIFRGYLMTAALLLTRRLSSRNAAACSVVGVAVAFSIAHLTTAGISFIQLCCIAATGCVYGLLRLQHRSTMASTLAHAAYNLALYVCYWCGWAS